MHIYTTYIFNYFIILWSLGNEKVRYLFYLLHFVCVHACLPPHFCQEYQWAIAI